jgi:heme o synthase
LTRFQRLAAITVATTFVLVTIGVIVRATESGMACPTWPGCFEGQFLPRLDDNYQVWLEWIHRTIAVVLGFLILGLAFLAVRNHRDKPSILWPSLVAVGLVGFQAWLGRETVRLNNSGESVMAHLTAAMILLALLVFVLVRSSFPARIIGRGSSQRFTLLAAFGTVATFALLLFGASVTSGGLAAAIVFPDWPLMNGTLFPPLTEVTTVHVLHRWVAIVVGLLVAAIALVALRTQRHRPGLVAVAVAIAVLYPIQAVIGGFQVLTQLAPWTQTLHLALAALIWGLSVALATASYYAARIAPPIGGWIGDVEEDAETGSGTGRTLKESVRAYVALTKPRIIELLLITTVPAMVLATREVPGIAITSWGALVVWTLVGGSLAAGSANAINCYLDRDIDELMARTRRRPLPAHQVEPERAVVFGIVLGVLSFGVLAWFVNLLAAFLALLAIGFYVVVYTIIMKRSTPQNIVIGGAAGALPPVIGWAAVTGNVGVPALLLFALVFYWTPPHFWALSLRIRKDYAAAGVPMLPVVRGIAETSRQIALYSILMVAISLVLWAVARMGPIYLVTAVVLGGIFLWQAYVLWRQGSAPEASTAQAIRLYKYSISYLTLLFVAVAVDTLVPLA